MVRLSFRISVNWIAYSRRYFEELIMTGRISEIRPSDVWYDSRTDFSEAAAGTSMPSHSNEGFELLQGSSVFSGAILGGCIDTIFDLFNNERYEDSPRMCAKYSLFPAKEDWEGKILLLESSEEQPSPEKYRRMIRALKATDVFDVINGILVGKPADERYAEEYKQILIEETSRPELPILANINIGHATPRCIIPFGVEAEADAVRQRISFQY